MEMKKCKKCGKDIPEQASLCMYCGANPDTGIKKGEVKSSKKQGYIIIPVDNVTRFLLTLILGWLGSFIINHSSLKPEGFKSRTLAYFFLSIITFGIYGLVASICNFTFDPAKERNIGYAKE